MYAHSLLCSEESSDPLTTCCRRLQAMPGRDAATVTVIQQPVGRVPVLHGHIRYGQLWTVRPPVSTVWAGQLSRCAGSYHSLAAIRSTGRHTATLALALLQEMFCLRTLHGETENLLSLNVPRQCPLVLLEKIGRRQANASGREEGNCG